jgi:proline dehydrogenase
VLTARLQFVGSDTAPECLPLLRNLRSHGKGALFAYSVEVDAAEAAGAVAGTSSVPAHKQIVEEMIHCIDVAAGFEDGITKDTEASRRRTWVAVKMV